MTLPPLDTWHNVRGVHGPSYTVGPRCSVPSCISLAQGAHHLWRRSRMGKAWDWIEIDDEEIVGNKTGLCFDHHEAVTGPVGGYKNAIQYLDGRFVWCNVVERGQGLLDFEPVAPLHPQPPTPESLAASMAEPVEEGSERCPSCGHLTRRRTSSTPPPGGARRRKSWTILVPDDSEDGAAVLDALFEDLAPLLHQDTDRGARYYVIVPALYYAQQDKRAFLASLEGVGG